MLFGVVGLFFGYWIQQFSQTVYILGAGLAFAAIVSRNILREKFQHFRISLHFHFFCSWLFLHGRCTDKNPWIGKNQDPKVNLKILNPRRKSSTFSSLVFNLWKSPKLCFAFPIYCLKKISSNQVFTRSSSVFPTNHTSLQQCRNIRIFRSSEFTRNQFCRF